MMTPDQISAYRPQELAAHGINYAIYDDELRVLRSVPDDDFYIEVIGNPNWGYYEWVIRRGPVIRKNSNVGYVWVAYALKDGLVAYTS